MSRYKYIKNEIYLITITQTRKLKLAFLLGVVLSLLLTIFYLMVENHNLASSLNFCNKCYIPKVSKDKIVYDLHKVFLYMQNAPAQPLCTKKEKQQARKTLERIIRLFEPAYNVPEEYPKTFQESRPYVCPEVFTNAKLAYPNFLTGSWIESKCKTLVPSFNVQSAITVVIVFDRSELFCLDRLRTFVKSIYHLNLEFAIRIAVRKGTNCADYYNRNSKVKVSNVKVVKFPAKLSSGVIWNEMIEAVTTPFTLVGRNLDGMNDFIRLNRQVSVFDIDPRIRIVSGSTRNRTGHWQVGCYQTRLFAYTLEYKEGYRHSRNECMICDYITGSFITKTKFLKRNKFQNISDDVLFEYFFLDVTLSSYLIFNCPDVLYMGNKIDEFKGVNDRLAWLPIVQKWKLNRVLFPDHGVVHKFSCQESGVSCDKLYLTTVNFMMPICCMDALANGLKAFHELSLSRGISYQLEGGSVLGAVKLRDVIPWDFDGDGIYSEKHGHLFGNVTILNAKHNISITCRNENAKGYFKISTPDAFIEMFARKELSVDVVDSEIFNIVPTLIRIRGVWVYGPPSPGLYARNYYGVEYLRHVNSWYARRQKMWDPYNKSDSFLPCKFPGHHACLDQFVVDGNIQFDFK